MSSIRFLGWWQAIQWRAEDTSHPLGNTVGWFGFCDFTGERSDGQREEHRGRGVRVALQSQRSREIVRTRRAAPEGAGATKEIDLYPPGLMPPNIVSQHRSRNQLRWMVELRRLELPWQQKFNEGRRRRAANDSPAQKERVGKIKGSGERGKVGAAARPANMGARGVQGSGGGQRRERVGEGGRERRWDGKGRRKTARIPRLRRRRSATQETAVHTISRARRVEVAEGIGSGAVGFACDECGWSRCAASRRPRDQSKRASAEVPQQQGLALALEKRARAGIFRGMRKLGTRGQKVSRRLEEACALGMFKEARDGQRSIGDGGWLQDVAALIAAAQTEGGATQRGEESAGVRFEGSGVLGAGARALPKAVGAGLGGGCGGICRDLVQIKFKWVRTREGGGWRWGYRSGQRGQRESKAGLRWSDRLVAVFVGGGGFGRRVWPAMNATAAYACDSERVPTGWQF
ncbi:hypothetical protein B0H13DRAFT_1861027 [Mycena leptocephala]|nr:hypothetical protein B0H13DRAFT_1861027 [Mycena leptocephala]